MPSDHRILITGATGLIGINLVRHLAHNGYRVRILARESSPLWPFKDLSLEIAKGDIGDLDSLHRALAECDTVFHLAGLVALNSKLRRRAEQVNVEGTRNIVTACRQTRITRLIHTSSISAIGTGTREHPATEDSSWNLKKHHITYYDTKRRAEEIVLKAVAAGQLDAVVVNPAYVVGPYDIKPSSGYFIQAIAEGRLKYYGRGGVNVVGVDDVVAGYVAAWKHGRPGERYILGSENLTYRELMSLIAERLGVPPPRSSLHPLWATPLGWLGNMFDWAFPKLFYYVNNDFFRSLESEIYVSSEKAIRELGYRPHPVRESVDAAIQWFHEHNMLPPQNHRGGI